MNDNEIREDGDHRTRSATEKALWITVAVLVLLVVAAYAWKWVAVGNVDERAEREREVLVERSREALRGQAIELLELTARPLAWGVRSHVLADDYGQVDGFFSELVRHPAVELVALAIDDSIRVATDRNLMGRAAEAVFPPSALANDTPSVVSSEEGDLYIFSPIVGFTGRRGTVILMYSGEAIQSRVPSPLSPPVDTSRSDTLSAASPD